MGSIVSSLSRLRAGYAQSLAAISMAKYRQVPLYAYRDMGFFRLLLAVDDAQLLNSYAQEYIGKLQDYDREHGSSYSDTLYQYLIHDGSIQAIASALFCHRNTVNYRVRTLKETFGYELDDPQTRFHLLTAYFIKEYLQIMGI